MCRLVWILSVHVPRRVVQSVEWNSWPARALGASILLHVLVVLGESASMYGLIRNKEGWIFASNAVVRQQAFSHFFLFECFFFLTYLLFSLLVIFFRRGTSPDILDKRAASRQC